MHKGHRLNTASTPTRWQQGRLEAKGRVASGPVMRAIAVASLSAISGAGEEHVGCILKQLSHSKKRLTSIYYKYTILKYGK